MFERLQEQQETNRRQTARMLAGISFAIAASGFLVRWCLQQETEQDASARRYVAPPPAPVDDKPHRVELPGMSLELPGSSAVVGDYRDGSYGVVHFGAKLTHYEISWKIGMLDPNIEQSIQRKLVDLQQSAGLRYPPELVHSEPLTMGTAPAKLFLIRTRPGDIKAGVIAATHGECGNRVVSIVVTSEDPLLEAERVVASFRCNPDAKHETFRADVVVDARAGWSRLDRPRLFLGNSKGVELQTALFQYAEGSVADIARRGLADIGARMAPHAGTRGDKVFWRGVGSDGLPLAIFGWRCKSRRVAVVLVQAAEGVPLDEGISLAETGRCLEPDEPMPDYPIDSR